jgi:hypothetical protein
MPAQHGRRQLTPRYAALLWSLGVSFVGGWLCAICFSAPYILMRTLVGDAQGFTSILELRLVQMAQIPISYLLGGMFCVWYFRRRLAVDVDQARAWVMRYRFVPFLFIGFGVLVTTAGSYGERIAQAWAADRDLAIRGVTQMLLTMLMLLLWDLLCAMRLIPAFYERYARLVAGDRNTPALRALAVAAG